MTHIFKQIARRIIKTAPQSVPAPCVAQRLLERADSDAGRDPFAAAELRLAARAFLSVVR